MIDAELAFPYNLDMDTISRQIDVELLREFERQLDPRHPEAGRIPARVLGYGEISTVLEIGGEEQRQLAYKRMPIFHSLKELEEYERIYVEYQQLLTEEVGLRLPPHGHASLVTDRGHIVFYSVQQRMDPASIGHHLVQRLATGDVLRLLQALLDELCKVWRYNRQQSAVEIGLDGQVSNWSVSGYDPARLRLDKDIQLQYLDTSTPLFRLDGEEQLNGELFLRSAPSFLAWLLKALFLEDVIDRYYDFRRVLIDLVANFYKEQLPQLVPDLVRQANEYLASEAADLQVAPLTLEEVRSYYRQDALIWRFYQGSRRVDRLLHTRILRRNYPYILPEIKKR